MKAFGEVRDGDDLEGFSVPGTHFAFEFRDFGTSLMVRRNHVADDALSRQLVGEFMGHPVDARLVHEIGGRLIGIWHAEHLLLDVVDGE